jgi:hypothetical protein
MKLLSETGAGYLKWWIRHHTEGYTGVAELGAGYFDKLGYVHSDARFRAGIELWEPCMASPKYTGCQRIHGNFMEYRAYIDPHTFPCVMMIDALEHVDKSDSDMLIAMMKEDFQKIMLMIPEGEHPQGPEYGNKYQSHLSTWHAGDILEYGFQQIIVYPYFHSEPGKATGAIFACWERNFQ